MRLLLDTQALLWFYLGDFSWETSVSAHFPSDRNRGPPPTNPVQPHGCAQRIGRMNQQIQGFVPLPLGGTHVKTPKTRKSDWLVVRRDWMPACQ